MFKILFLGGMFPKNINIVENNSKGSIQYAANVLQWNIIDALKNNPDVELTLGSAYFIGSYPKRYSRIRIVAETYECNGVKLDVIPFLNLPVVKNISRQIHVKRYIQKWIAQNDGEQLYIIAYSADTPFIYAINRIKRRYRCIQTHLIVPDLPEHMNLGKNVGFAYTLLKNGDMQIQTKVLSAIDGFTFLTKWMSEEYNIFNKPYCVVEGMINPNDRAEIPANKNNSDMFSIVYTGTLNERYGVMKLVEAMKYIHLPNIQLVLCGEGDAHKLITEASIKDKRIQYKGQVTRDVAIKYQQEAGVLVNPRNGEEDFTKYSFPSKNLEYMMHKRPVLVFKLPGIPDEYDDILKYFHGASPEVMAKDIMDIYNMTEDERTSLGERITSFAVEQKNNVSQTSKILSVLLDDKG